jgi:lysophospholipase L1-like esterase
MVALLVGVLVALGLCEVLTRVVVPDPYVAVEDRSHLFQQDDYVAYKNRPNYRGYAYGTIPIRTNSLGFRGGEVRQGSSALRIVGLGDSVMWGTRTREEKTFLRVLESRLNATRPVEVVNTAVIGYSLHQELRTMQRDGAPLEPKLVLLAYVLNDFYPTENPFYNLNFHEPARPGFPRRYYSPLATPPSYFWQLLRSGGRILKEKVTPQGYPPPPPSSWTPDSFEARSWPVMQRHFIDLKRVVNEHGGRLLVMIFPRVFQVNGSSDHPFPQSLMGEFLQSAGVDYIDLFDTLRGKGSTAFYDEYHLTVLGHQLVADRIAQELERRQWLQQLKP